MWVTVRVVHYGTSYLGIFVSRYVPVSQEVGQPSVSFSRLESPSKDGRKSRTGTELQQELKTLSQRGILLVLKLPKCMEIFTYEDFDYNFGSPTLQN